MRNERLKKASGLTPEEVLTWLHTSMDGLSKDQVETNEEEFGKNVITTKDDNSVLKRLKEAFINPFSIILMVLVVVSFFSDVILAQEKDFTTIIIITIMVVISGGLRFVQEGRSNNAAEKLSEMIEVTTLVKRKGFDAKEMPLDEVVVGDIIYFSAGDMIPADVRLLSVKDVFITQASLSGESDPIEKFVTHNAKEKEAITDISNLAFMGSNLVSGSAIGVVVSVGDDTLFGDIAHQASEKTKEETSFEKGVNNVSKVLIRFMLVMVPIVFIANGLTKGDWLHALMFAISIAVGLTPEMLPMITTTCLAKGAVSMSKKKVIVKNINSIQNFGAMDVLCTDKTGTLTKDKVILQLNLDVHGKDDRGVLRYGLLNSYFQTGLKNLLDLAIINKSEEFGFKDKVIENYKKIDEIPFDFNRRRMSVVVKDKVGDTQIITKGAFEEILSVCKYVESEGLRQELDNEIIKEVSEVVENLNREGMRVLAVAQKVSRQVEGQFSVSDESDMTLIGYLAFLDPPKESSAKAIEALMEYGVEVKILTGDNDKVTRSVCRQVGINADRIILGYEVDDMDDAVLQEALREVNIFAKLSPSQKSRIVKVLKEQGSTVGFMGDGINDAPAMNAADIGISVDTAVDIAKESADIILLEKDLMVLEQGVIEGRKTYANMIKYIKMTASSNFGNMFSVLLASAFLPFLPMSSVQLIFLNLIYDLSCTAIPWDHVDDEYVKQPKDWSAKGVSSFMKWVGPTSSIFDVTTYLLMYFVICPMMCGGQLFTQINNPALQLQYVAIFQTGWLIESMWTQVLVVHMIRSEKLPFIKSRASAQVFFFGILAIALVSIAPMTPLKGMLKLHELPNIYYLYLVITLIGYMILTTIIKKVYIKKHGELL